jgi:hypothetical protein
MSIQGIRQSNRKEIDLPESGLKVVIRKLTPYDFIGTGNIPDTLAQLEGQSPDLTKMDPTALQFILSAVCNVVVDIPGETIALVPDKPSKQQGPEVLSVWEIPSGDLNTLIAAVFNFTNWGGPGVEPGKFPEKQETASPAGQVS